MRELLFFLFISHFCFSQTHRFEYDFKYKNNVNENYKTETFYLDIIKDDVVYMHKQTVWADSVNRNNPHGKSLFSLDYPQVKSKKNSTKYSHYMMVNNDYYVFETDDPIKWNLANETKMEGNVKLQKATAEFGGRNWTAWFTNYIPLSEGPYKFRGLPGLVVEVSDNKQNFIFKLVKNYEIKDSNPEILDKVFLQKPLKVSLTKYNEIVLNDYNNPYQQFRNMKPGSWSIRFEDGRTITTMEQLDELRKEYQRQIKDNYNPLELDKAMKLSAK